MTVPNETYRSGPYSCNGSTVAFPFGFKVVNQSHISVIKTDANGVDTVLTLGAHYSVSGVGNDAGGTVTTTSAYAAGNSISLVLDVPFTQDTDLENQGAYNADDVERMADLAVMRDLQLLEMLSRCVRVPVSQASTDVEALTHGLLALSPMVTQIETLAAIQSAISALAPVASSVPVVAGMSGVLSNTMSALLATENTYTGDGVTTAFTLSRAPGAATNVILTIGGVPQSTAHYSVSGTTLTIAPAVAVGVSIVARVLTTLSASGMQSFVDAASGSAAAASGSAAAASGSAASSAASAAAAAASAAGMPPPGAVMHFAMSSAPNGWLKANGALVSRTTYAALFATIGTTFGVGDGSTTFGLPDLRGEFLRGWDDGRGVDTSRALGSAQDQATLAHTHTGTTTSAGAHTHTVPLGGSGGTNPVATAGSGSTTTTSSAGAHNHAFTTDASSGAETRPRNVALLACIKY